MLVGRPVRILPSLWPILILAVCSLPGIAQDKSSCRAYFQVVQKDQRIAGGFVAGMNTGTVTDTYGQTVGTIDGTTTTTTTTPGLAEKQWHTASISVVRISSEGKIEFPAIYFHTAGASLVEGFSPVRWSSDSQKALEAALKFLTENK